MSATELNDSSAATNSAAASAAQIVTTTMRERSAFERLVMSISASMNMAVRINWPQAAREKARSIASAMMPSATAQRPCKARGDHVLQHEQRWQDQECAEHVGVLERAATAAIQRQEIISAGHKIEVAPDRRKRGEDSADDQ